MQIMQLFEGKGGWPWIKTSFTISKMVGHHCAHVICEHVILLAHIQYFQIQIKYKAWSVMFIKVNLNLHH